MKALSVKQPYASEIASGDKWIEWRGRNTRYRGPLVIVSSLSPDLPGKPVGTAVAVVTIANSVQGGERQWAWLLDKVRPLKIPIGGYRGRLGFWEISPPSGGFVLRRARLRPSNAWHIPGVLDDGDWDPKVPIRTFEF